MASLTLRNIVKKYGQRQVIHGLDLDIADGEFAVLVGPSGCGKSTLLRMISGLEEITGGEVLVNGQVANRMQPRQRNIAMVFQDFALYPHMSVRKNMAFALRMAGISRAERDAAVERAAEMLGLTQELERYPSELSGGQKQRVAMGRALVRNPEAFLFDEPLSNLDAKLRVQMRLEIKNLQRRLNTTSVYVTHDQVEAMTMADRLVVMNAGRAEQVGTPMDVYANPASVYVGGFIGSPAMNFMTGTLDANGRGVRLGGAGTDGVTMELPGPVRAGTRAQQVLVGVRPEDFVLNHGIAELPMRIDIIEPLGADTLLYCRAPGQAQPVIVRRPGYEQPVTGTSTTYGITAGKAHVFDVETGRRLEMEAA